MNSRKPHLDTRFERLACICDYVLFHTHIHVLEILLILLLFFRIFVLKQIFYCIFGRMRTSWTMPDYSGVLMTKATSLCLKNAQIFVK